MLADVKSIGLVARGRALFPDAPGARHVRELTAHARSGGDSRPAFVVQGSRVQALTPHADLDPEFASALAEARLAKVRVLGFSCRVREDGAEIRGRLPSLKRESADREGGRGGASWAWT